MAYPRPLSEKTIAAIATAPVRSGIGIVRISGNEAIDVADRIFRGKISLKDAKSGTIHYGMIYDGADLIDEVLVSVFLAPHSYTTENVAEINCHGGPFVLNSILDVVLRNGAELAEPGEFTKRAFLGGRIDLSQAEAVMDLISSENEFARKGALERLSGSLSEQITDMRDELLSQVAHIEAALDDPEHISIDDVAIEYPKILKDLSEKIEKMIRASKDGSVIAEGIPTVIIGKPNVGKSSIWNRMVGRDQAIVTDIPGTTRDILQETVKVGDISLRISDTAGIRQTDDFVEGIGVEKALLSIDQASLVLIVIDGSRKIDEQDISILNAAKDRHVIVLLNKSDLESVVFCEDIFDKIDYEPAVIDISALSGDGMEDLCNEIRRMYVTDQISEYESMAQVSERVVVLLKKAKESVDLALEGIDSGVSEEFLTVDLMDAYRSLGLIIGLEIEDDLVDKIFSDFCMGK